MSSLNTPVIPDYMTAATAIVALLISVASFWFSIYQYRILNRVRIGERKTSLLRFTHDLLRKFQYLKHLIDSTDDVDDCAEFLANFNILVEQGIAKIANSRRTTLQSLFEIEQRLLPLGLEIDLLYKQVEEAGKLNEEIRVHLATKREAP